MKVFITAGEASGDRLAADLMAGLRDFEPSVQFAGVGGSRMAEQGLQSLFPMEELSVMGLAEILPKYFALKRRIKETAAAAVAWGADVVISVDAPEFSLRVAKEVKAQSDILTVHYVAPTVWAWRPGRASKMARHVDHVLALFPFEPDLMRNAGMTCDFVGHPVVSDLIPTEAEVSEFKAAHSLTKDKTLLVLPGSRRSEVDRLMPVFTQVLADPAFAGLDLLFPTLPHLENTIAQHCEDLPQRTIMLSGDGTQAAHTRRIAYAAAKVALAASGTVSLELAAVGTPMVIAYDMHWLSRMIISRLLLTDTVTLVSLVSNSPAVPEFVGKNCKPDLISAALQQAFANPDAQSDAMQITMARLGQGGPPPGLRAAQSVLDRLNR